MMHGTLKIRFTCPARFDDLKLSNQRVLYILQSFQNFLQKCHKKNTFICCNFLLYHFLDWLL